MQKVWFFIFSKYEQVHHTQLKHQATMRERLNLRRRVSMNDMWVLILIPTHTVKLDATINVMVILYTIITKDNTLSNDTKGFVPSGCFTEFIYSWMFLSSSFLISIISKQEGRMNKHNKLMKTLARGKYKVDMNSEWTNLQ